MRTAGLRHHVMLLRHRQTRNCASWERAYTVSKCSGCEPSGGLLSSAICSSLRLRACAVAHWYCTPRGFFSQWYELYGTCGPKPCGTHV